MYRGLIICIVFLSFSNFIFSANIRGTVNDAKTREELVGATIYIKELKQGTISGLDGSFVIKNIPKGNYTIQCSYISYQTIERKISVTESELQNSDFTLIPQYTELDEVNVVGRSDKSTDISARSSERNSNQVINVVSAKTIELSPDLNVANALQRMSGVTLDKSSSGSGQYALLRGMDKRYNYTLVNGIKIPSTHNKHRYVSLDMFPSDMVDRIEVSKTLTPNMEGDAVAGAVNLVMKNAPDNLLVQANVSAGYSHFFSENDFQTFSSKTNNLKSPYERNEHGYRTVPSDFPNQNLIIKTVDVPINAYGNLTLGNRFFKKRLGWILSGSYQNTYTGENSLYFKDDLSRDGKNLPVLISMQERIYNENKRNYGIHNKFDYQFNDRHRIQLYAAYLDFATNQLREVQSTDLAVSYDPDNGNLNRSHSSRFRFNSQSLFTTTLQGDHRIFEMLSANWSAVYSKASNQTPDEATVKYGNGLESFKPVRQYIDFDGSDRIWRRNSDEDKAGYLNFTYTPTVFGSKAEIISGAMYREKNRTSFYNKYTLNAIVRKSDNTTSFYSEKGVDWNTYDGIIWQVYNPRGTVAVGENYDAFETVMAAYSMFRVDIQKIQVCGGVRVENTEQGYSMKYPIGEPNPDGSQKYTDVLPSIHLKYSPFQNQNFRLSYYRAINKPGFQEIVPYIDASEEPVTAGNKNLRHAVADNFDLRWEFFPGQLDQVMVGTFYKRLKDPIEFAFDKFMNVSQQIVYAPINSDKATNYGIELDVIKYYREWGVKGNYTLTRSEITSEKLSRGKDANGNDITEYVSQTRPLFGQSAHVGNISLLYKGSNNGFSSQLAFSYTGDRIYTVSRYIDNDLWQKGFWQLDASAEKKLNHGISLFVKAHNLLNSHVKVYIKKMNPLNNDVPLHGDDDKNTLVRDEYSMSSYLIGIRYKL
ncbi:MAG: TonB-dependent receptor [Prolixibacteraceae bacterium]|nr:TonB-dependent receptor [Prolixibacteraceae bacterium]